MNKRLKSGRRTARGSRADAVTDGLLSGLGTATGTWERQAPLSSLHGGPGSDLDEPAF